MCASQISALKVYGGVASSLNHFVDRNWLLIMLKKKENCRYKTIDGRVSGVIETFDEPYQRPH